MQLFKVIFLIVCIVVSMVPDSIAYAQCDNGWKQYGQYCYTYQDNSVDWKSASEGCMRMGGFLASVHSEEQNAFLGEIVKEFYQDDWWIGLSNHEIDGSFEWAWDDGSIVNFTFWKPDKPPDVSNIETCIAANFNRGIPRMWKARLSCSSTLRYICQKKVSMVPDPIADNVNLPPCEYGWKRYDQHCYKREENVSDWKRAAKRCRSMGGYLASIHSKEQNDFINKIPTTNDIMNGYGWIGLYYSNIDGKLAWDDGSDLTFTSWPTGQPLPDYSGVITCFAEYFNYGINGKWHPSSCSSTRPYICQRKVSMVPDAIAEKIILPRCENGWKQYDQHCYKLEENELSRFRASEKCKSMGGYLASIHSKEQNDFFLELSKKSRKFWWIGLHPNINGFAWDDGSDVTYTNWEPDEPREYFSDIGMCVSEYNYEIPGTWKVFSCRSTLPYICQRKVSRNATGSSGVIHDFVSAAAFTICLFTVIVFHYFKVDNCIL